MASLLRYSSKVISKRCLASNVMMLKGVKEEADFKALMEMDIFKNSKSYQPVQKMEGQSERKGDLGYMTFKTENDKLNAIISCNAKFNMLAGKGAQFNRKALEALPHDPHEILNFSRVSGSALTAADFRDQGISNVAEVYQFPKYGEGGKIIEKGNSTYNVRFDSVKSCKAYWSLIKSGETKPVLNNMLCKVTIFKDAEKQELDKKFKRKSREAKRAERSGNEKSKPKRYTISDSV